MADTFLVRRRATLVSNRLNMPVRSLLPSSLTVTSVTLTSALCWEPRLLSLAVIVAKSSQGGEEEETGPLVFPFDRVADRMVCSIGVRNKRLNVIGVDSDDEGCDGPSGIANLERFVGSVGGGGGGGGGEREDLDEDAMTGVVG